MIYQITNQKDLRKAFWRDETQPRRSSALSRKRLPNGDYPTDTRVAFVDYVDMLARDGVISEALAQRATLR